MPPVPEGYPSQLDDDGLDSALERLIQTPATWLDFILPELTIALMGALVR